VGAWIRQTGDSTYAVRSTKEGHEPYTVTKFKECDCMREVLFFSICMTKRLIMITGSMPFMQGLLGDVHLQLH